MDISAVKRRVQRIVGLKPKRWFIVQIELAGKCTANCEFCDWTNRPPEQKTFMETVLAKKAVKEAIEMDADHISFHVTGEPLDHPDLFEILPKDRNFGISTNCLSLEGAKADRLAKMKNLNLILAILWSEPEIRRERSINNAKKFLDRNPECRRITIQMICSEHAVPYAGRMVEEFSPYLEKIPQLKMFFKQPYTQEYGVPIYGFVPQRIPESNRIIIDRMETPQSCGNDCMAIPPNPMTSLLIQVDGEIKPCFYRPDDPLKKEYAPEKFKGGWKFGNIRDTTLQEVWGGEKLREMRKIWATGDPDNQLPCYNCIRMIKPRGKPMWWYTTGTIPCNLDGAQSTKGDPDDPYPKPEEK